jgi:hypothetical protein
VNAAARGLEVLAVLVVDDEVVRGELAALLGLLDEFLCERESEGNAGGGRNGTESASRGKQLQKCGGCAAADGGA